MLGSCIGDGVLVKQVEENKRLVARKWDNGRFGAHIRVIHSSALFRSTLQYIAAQTRILKLSSHYSRFFFHDSCMKLVVDQRVLLLAHLNGF